VRPLVYLVSGLGLLMATMSYGQIPATVKPRGENADSTRRLSQGEEVSIYRHLPGPRFAEAVVAYGTIWLAGQVPANVDCNAQQQTANVLEQIDKQLAELGSDKTKIVDATVFLADMADYDAMNTAWDAWAPAGHSPARATVGAQLANPSWKVEIKVVAVR
jgi:enamine deaminase RidA (YjgF/YER057c/UK114 family)